MVINSLLEMPLIYKLNSGYNKMSMIAKLQTSSHNLQIEMGRRTSTAKDSRKCLCGDDVEDEYHFLLQCRMYTVIRQKHSISALISVW